MHASRFVSACLLLLLCCVTAPGAFAQSADQQIVSVVDSPDPVVPGEILTYTVTMTNHGPDPATNGGANINVGGGLAHVSHVAPPGYTCFFFGSAISCITPSMAAGTTAVLTLRMRVDESLLNFPDGSIGSTFSTSGTTPDPNNGNNGTGVTTAYDSPQIDLALTVLDSPDPVGPDGDITYSAQVTQAGPDDARNVNFNVYNNNTLRFRSVVAPAGFSCVPPAVGGAPVFSCNAPTLAPGSYAFTVVLRAELAVLGANDGTVQTVFGAGGIGNDVNRNNDSETETTAYVTPDADVAIEAVDSVDPALLGERFDYLVSVRNDGPDPSTGTSFSFTNNGSLRFVALEAPAGWSCAPPAVGAAPIGSCTLPLLAVGASAEFVVGVRGDAAQLGPHGGNVVVQFTGNGARSDPEPTDNTVAVTTTVESLDLFRDGFEGG